MTTAVTNALRKALTDPNELVTYHNDPNFYVALDVLPNPDPILAKLGKDQSAYLAIQYDGHVMGDVRSLRSGLLGYEWRIKAGGDDPDSVRAHELIQAQLLARPTQGLSWNDWYWSIYKAILQGQALHEVGWQYDGQYLWPAYIKERPPQRFRYSLDNELRYLTRLYPIQGESAPDTRRFLITRHMQSHDNPYGVAVLSACFWPYTFKHSGWKWFAKFAEKYGIPWAIGRYPAGADTKQQQELAQRLAAMIEDAVAAIPEGSGVELLSPSAGGSGDPIQERLINLANREMSKALTSQTLSSEQVGNGSRAASETHRDRQMAIASSDRTMVSETINQLLAWITELNFPNAMPPRHEFYQEEDARKNWADTLDVARKYLPIGQRFAYDRLQIEPPAEGDELLTSADPTPANFRQGGHLSASDFKKAVIPPLQQAIDDTLPVADTLQQQAQDLLEPLLNRAQTLFEQGAEPEQIIIELMSSFPLMDSKQLEETLTRILYVTELAGQWEAQQDADNDQA